MSIFDDDFSFSNSNNQTYDEYLMKQLKRILSTIVNKGEVPAKVAKFIYSSAKSSSDRKHLVSMFVDKYDMGLDQGEAAGKVLIPYVKKGMLAYKKQMHRRRRRSSWDNYDDTGLDEFSSGSDWDDDDIVDDDDVFETNNSDHKKEERREVKEPRKEENVSVTLSEEEEQIIEEYKRNPIDTFSGANGAGMSRLTLSGVSAMIDFYTAKDPTTTATYQIGLSHMTEPMFSPLEIMSVLNEHYKTAMSNYFSIVKYDQYYVIDEKYSVVTSGMKKMYDAFNRNKTKEMLDIFQSQSYNFVTCLQELLIANINEYLVRYLKLDHTTVTIKITDIAEINDLATMIMETPGCKQLAALDYSTLNEIIRNITDKALADFIRDPQSSILNPNEPTDRHLITMNPNYTIRGHGYHEKMHFESLEAEDQKKFLDVIMNKTIIKVPREMVITDIANKALEKHLITASKKKKKAKEGMSIITPMENNNPFATFMLTKLYKEPQDTGYPIPGITNVYHINNKTNKFFITRPGLTLRSNLITVT